MPKLTIIDDDGSELFACKITGPIDTPKVSVAVMQAIESVPKPKKTRVRNRTKKTPTTPSVG